MAASLTEEARKKANLRVLQRTDQDIVDILGHATHVVIYVFHRQHQKWEKLDVEGSLFLVKRSTVPRFRLIVLNRTNPDNFQVDMTPQFQIQVKDPYLIFRQKDTIKGIWFHNAKERQDMATLLPRVVQSLEVDPTSAASALLQGVALKDGTADDPHQSKTANNVPTPPPPPVRQATPLAAVGGSRHSTTPTSASVEPPPVLDKKSLQLALLSLIQDERFLDLIHAQYLKVSHARAHRKPDGGGS